MNRGLFAVCSLVCLGFSAGACDPSRLAHPELTASLRADSAEIGVRSSELGFSAKIGFVYTNTTDGPVAKAGCGFPPLPELQKKVDGQWVPAYYPVYLLCLTKPDFSLPSGSSYRGVLDFFAARPGQNWAPVLLVDSIDGVYRLEWDFVEGTDTEIKNARIIKAFSNEFRMVLAQ